MKGKFYVAVLIGILACGEVPLEGTLDAGPADAGPVEVDHGCEERGTGNGIGDQLRNATFINCLGEEVRLHDGAAKINYRSLPSAQSGALPARLTSEASPSTTPSLAARHAQWDYLIAVAQDATGSPDISPEECLAYAELVEADPAKMVIDPNFSITMGTQLIDVCPMQRFHLSPTYGHLGWVGYDLRVQQSLHRKVSKWVLHKLARGFHI